MYGVRQGKLFKTDYDLQAASAARDGSSVTKLNAFQTIS